jgi:hypothetical protein
MGRMALAVILQMAFLIPAVVAQSNPALHTRDQADQGTQTHAAKGFSTLPETASGEYELDDRGSVVQITIEQNRLTGYVTQMDQGLALTLSFDHATLAGNHVSFTTKTVHGLRYSFAGAIVRGDAVDQSQTGFYRLTGDWTTYRSAQQTTRRVNLRSTPRPQ